MGIKTKVDGILCNGIHMCSSTIIISSVKSYGCMEVLTTQGHGPPHSSRSLNYGRLVVFVYLHENTSNPILSRTNGQGKSP